MKYNQGLREFMDALVMQADILNQFDMWFEIREGNIFVKHAGREDAYTHSGGADSIAVGALAWHFEQAKDDPFGCYELLQTLHRVAPEDEV